MSCWEQRLTPILNKLGPCGLAAIANALQPPITLEKDKKALGAALAYGTTCGRPWAVKTPDPNNLRTWLYSFHELASHRTPPAELLEDRRASNAAAGK
jgi:hypothetical protein